jgi:hypothetical protein
VVTTVTQPKASAKEAETAAKSTEKILDGSYKQDSSQQKEFNGPINAFINNGGIQEANAITEVEGVVNMDIIKELKNESQTAHKGKYVACAGFQNKVVDMGMDTVELSWQVKRDVGGPRGTNEIVGLGSLSSKKKGCWKRMDRGPRSETQHPIPLTQKEVGHQPNNKNEKRNRDYDDEEKQKEMGLKKVKGVTEPVREGGWAQENTNTSMEAVVQPRRQQ